MASTTRLSVIQYLGEGGSTCGYCHSEEDTSFSAGMWCHTLSVEQYQQLIDRGWRRSGCYVYKPNMQRTCCPQYTIRLDTHQFQPNKASKRVLRKWNAFLAGELPDVAADAVEDEASSRIDRVGSAEKRQKISHDTEVEPSSSSRSGQLRATQAPQTATKQQPEEQARQHAVVFQELLKQAIETCVQRGELPIQGGNQVIKVSQVTKKQAKLLPAGAQLTSPVPRALVGTFCRALGAETPSLESVADTVAAAIKSRLQDPAWTAVHGKWWVQVLNGHINFIAASEASQTPSQPLQPASTVGHTGVQGLTAITIASGQASNVHRTDRPAPGQVSDTHRTDEPAHWPNRARLRLDTDAMQEEDEGLLGNSPTGSSPTSSITNMWAGLAMNASLKSDMAEQQHQLPSQAGLATDVSLRSAMAEQPQQSPVQAGASADAKLRGAGAVLSSPQLAAGAVLSSPQSAGRALPSSPPFAGKALPSSPQLVDRAVPSKLQAFQSQAADSASAVGAAISHSNGKAQDEKAETLSYRRAGQPEAFSLRQTGQAWGQSPRQTGHGRRRFEIKMVPSSPELIETEFPLYFKYQVSNHHDDPKKVTRKAFKRFLIDCPFGWSPCEAYPAGKCPPCGFGAFHQQYWLDGKLVAVGVVDILPKCLSSKYFFWDNDYAHLAPGKFSALKEAEWVQRAAATCPALHYYYMGFYIHSCHKMRYKADYHPSDLLCPERFCWVPFDRVKAALDEQEYQVLSDIPGAVEGLGSEHAITSTMRQEWQSDKLSNAQVSPELLAASLVYWKKPSRPAQAICFGDVEEGDMPKSAYKQLQRQVEEWLTLAGPAAARMLFVP